MRRSSRHARELARPRLALRLCVALGDTPDVRRRVAPAIGVTERTLRRWAQRRRAGKPLVRPRGRRPSPVARHRRQGVIGALRRLGPCAGVPVLRGLFRDVPYRTIAKLKRRFVRAIQRRRAWHRRKLLWPRAGAAWATDFTHPEARLPGTSNRLCLVRDLGSGAQLAAAPARASGRAWYVPCSPRSSSPSGLRSCSSTTAAAPSGGTRPRRCCVTTASSLFARLRGRRSTTDRASAAAARSSNASPTSRAPGATRTVGRRPTSRKRSGRPTPRPVRAARTDRRRPRRSPHGDRSDAPNDEHSSALARRPSRGS